MHSSPSLIDVRQVQDDQWQNLLRLTRAIIEVLPDEIRKIVLITMVPVLQDVNTKLLFFSLSMADCGFLQRLVNNPPSIPSPDKLESLAAANMMTVELASLMDAISRMHPQIFYKPLFTLAASSKDFAVANHLCSIVAIARWLPDFWVRDAEMIAVAVMSEVSGGAKGRLQPASSLGLTKREYGLASLGQSVILVEVIGQFQKARKSREAPSVRVVFVFPTQFFTLTSFQALQLQHV